ncbi:hypothetical protein B5M09_005129 [Aphanomyces astaci]|uniref:Histidine acid phosphatase n=1 Tax=Aphanomyces astaci TaxID=112090 RepID=A0A3R7XTU8_APHAT|nr:hypothetical protein B5M09_005129 [Aphanomyces astaci]
MPGGVWPKGHLTEQGVADMERRGRAFRRRYQVFLANINIHDVVYATSTNIRRTILSAQSFLAGLCHDIVGLTSDNPFVLHTVDPKELTPILTGHDYRQGAQHAREVALSTLPGYKALEDAVKDVLGIRGVMAPQRRRLTLVSAHDNSLVALVCALQLHHSSGIIAPSYGSMLVVEVYRDNRDGSHHVDVHWDGKPLRFPNQTTSLVHIQVLHAAIASFVQAHSPAHSSI